MPEKREWDDYVTRLQDVQRSRPDPFRVAEARQNAARAVSTLEHPGWNYFEVEILNEMARVKGLIDTQKRFILDSTEPSDKLEPLRYHLRHLEGLLIGLTYCVDLLPSVIKKGEELVAGALSGAAAQ